MNPVALITGASRGIGRGIALELARVGYDLIINFVSNHSAAKSTAAECRQAASAAGLSIRAELCQADIALTAARQSLIAFAQAEFGRLDLLVNNAGIAPAVRADLLEAGEESFDRLLQVNVKAPFFLTQLAAKWMIEQAQAGTSAQLDPPRKPKIVTISSISAYTASVNRGDYCISKAALSMLTPLYAARLASFGIQVYEIRPGIISTDMTLPVQERYDQLIASGLTPIARWGTPTDVGKAVVALALELFPFSTGDILNVDGGFHLRRL